MTTAARAVMPWTWARVLRDQGPRSRDFLCVMLVLRTWMDESGFAYPSNRTWAKAARMSINTLRKHIQTAKDEGWLGVNERGGVGQKWKLNTYRCAVPDVIELTEKDEMLAIALVSQFGDIDEGVSSIAGTPSPRLNSQCVSSMSDTASPGRNRSPTEGVSNGHGKVCQNTPEGVSNQPASCTKAVSAESRKSLTINETAREVLRSPHSEVSEVTIKGREGAALTRNTATGVLKTVKTARSKTSELTGTARLEAAKKLTLAAGIAAAVSQYRLNRTEAEELAAECNVRGQLG